MRMKTTLASLASGFLCLLPNPKFYSHSASWRVVICTPLVLKAKTHMYIWEKHMKLSDRMIRSYVCIHPEMIQLPPVYNSSDFKKSAVVIRERARSDDSVSVTAQTVSTSFYSKSRCQLLAVSTASNFSI
jgi:hypothetical protein